MRKTIIAAVAIAVAIGAARADKLSPDNFVCPENLTDQNARHAEMLRFGEWTVREHPEWNTVRKATEGRISVLTLHGCTKTLRNLKAEPQEEGVR